VPVIVIVTGLGPQLKVMMPPLATALTTAADVQLAGLPAPMTWLGTLVLAARPAAGTSACPLGLPVWGAPLEYAARVRGAGPVDAGPDAPPTAIAAARLPAPTNMPKPRFGQPDGGQASRMPQALSVNLHIKHSHQFPIIDGKADGKIIIRA
jgi:hypothetical protein